MTELPGDLTTLGAAAAARLIASGRMTSLAYVESLLDRAARREPLVRAWAHLEPDRVREAARQCDGARVRGPLHGIPIGIKDVIDTADMPTEHNSPIYAGRRPTADADCVRRLKSAGAIIMGKTVTAEFAFMRPGPTRNPHDPARTPGGSSSGSGAAVADRMVPAALATQTGGSTIRPASFCGVFGYKPAFGEWRTAGLKYLAPSLDTLGLCARDLDDIALISAVLRDKTPAPPAANAPPAVVVWETPYAALAEPSALAALEAARSRAGRAGARIRALAEPGPPGDLNAAHRVIMAAETARSFAAEWRDARDSLSQELRSFIETGLRHDANEIAEAWAVVARWRRWLDAVVAPHETVLTLSTPGEAPVGLAATGNAIFNRLWTLLHAACLHIPTGVGPAGVPVGVQLVDPRGREDALLSSARWLVDILGARSVPLAESEGAR